MSPHSKVQLVTDKMGTPAWWSQNMPELAHRRELMQNVDKWQTMYVRYKCQPEAQVSNAGWDLSTSQRYADQLLLEEQLPYINNNSLLHNSLAPTSISLRIIEAPAEFAVPVKQDRRLTPNFKVRVDVSYKERCAFPLTLKAYAISQQEKDSVPEWVPDDFLDPDLPMRKPVTELKGTTVITHHFEATAGGSPKHVGKQSQQTQLSNMLGGVDPSLLASMGLTGDLDPQMVEQVIQDSVCGGGIDPAAAAALAAAAQIGGANSSAALEALSTALSTAAGAAEMQGIEAKISHDYEFSSVELVKPTRMNKVYLVFACSVLEQDLMFAVYDIPTVGICRAEQRVKACQKLGINFADLGLDLYNDNPIHLVPSPLQRQLGMSNGLAAAAAQQQQRKRGSWGDPNQIVSSDNNLGHANRRSLTDAPNNVMGGDLGAGSESNLAALAAGELGMAAMGIGGGYVSGDNLMGGSNGGLGGGLNSPEAMNTGMVVGSQGVGNGNGIPNGQGYNSHGQTGYNNSGLGQGLGFSGGSQPQLRSRGALRDLLVEEYETTGLVRKLSPLDLQSLESIAGFPIGSSGSSDVTISQQQWDEFVMQYRVLLKLLRQIHNVWNLQDPSVIAGFDMDRLGTVQALSLEPVGTFICRFSMSQPGCLVISCRVAPTHPNADGDGILHAIIKLDDLFDRRVETWIRDFAGATHILDVYKNKRVDKRKVFASSYTRLRAMQAIEAYDDILI